MPGLSGLSNHRRERSSPLGGACGFAFFAIQAPPDEDATLYLAHHLGIGI